MATKRWIGDAIAIKQVDTITIGGGLWVAGETITVTINSKDLILTVGATITNDSIAAQLNAAINAASTAATKIDTETYNIGGREIPEMRDFTASVASAVVTVTSVKAGVPFTIAVTETSTLGTATHAGEATAATGPNHANDADNWEGGLLTDGDEARFDQGNVPMLYELDYFRAQTIEFTFVRTTDYAGTIGLPQFNVGGYHEYRGRYFQLYDATVIVNVDFLQGDANGTGGTTYLDADGQTITDVNIEYANRTGGNDIVDITGGIIATCSIGRANVALEPVTGVAVTIMQVTTLNVGGGDISDRETNVITGDGSLTGLGTTNINGGATVSLGGNRASVVITGGSYESRGDTTNTGITIKGGSCSVACTGQITEANVWTNGTLDFGNTSMDPPTVSSIIAYGGSTINFAGKTITAPTPTGCFLHEVNITY